MSRGTVKLVHVSVENGKTVQSNKFYNMFDEGNGQFRVEYGRVGKNPRIEHKSIHLWDSVYRQKTGERGYTDVTHLYQESVQTPTSSLAPAQTSNSKTGAIKNSMVKRLFDDLMAFANKSIKTNYKVTQDSVTQAQVDEAQYILNTIAPAIKVGANLRDLNDKLLKLFTVIPREMKDVRTYLFQPLTDSNVVVRAQQRISDEQDILDAMAGQVKLLQQQKQSVAETPDKAVSDEPIDLLTQMGLEVREADNSEIEMVKKLMGPNAHQVKKVFALKNKTTQKKFDGNLKNAKDKKTELFWHGSRNENWFNLVQQGLLIRPSGAVYTGSMFSDGIYLADKAQKSINYTSLRGSYYTRGNSEKAYLALFKAHVGNQRHIYKHDSSCYEITYAKLQKDGFDSVFAHGGADLINNEYVVYTTSQCTIEYFVEIG